MPPEAVHEMLRLATSRMYWAYTSSKIKAPAFSIVLSKKAVWEFICAKVNSLCETNVTGAALRKKFGRIRRSEIPKVLSKHVCEYVKRRLTGPNGELYFGHV